MKAADIAAVCHEANRALTRLVGDVPVQPEWGACGADMQQSCVRGVEYALANPAAPPSAQHEAWMAERLSQGWRLGPVKDSDKKEHPALRPYADLPEEVRRKDALFKAVVGALS